MSWKKTITDDRPATKSSWKDTIQDAPKEVSKLESGARGVAQGVTLGFADEIAGGAEALWDSLNPSEKRSFKELYESSRNESRANFKTAQEANPKTYMSGEVTGMVGTAFIPGLNAASGAKLGAVAGRAALQGAIAGAGVTEADLDSVEGIKDVAKGAGWGAVGGAVGHGIGKIAQKASKADVNKIASKGASVMAGVDEDAALRQILRPGQSAIAQGDDFAYKLGNKAIAETEELGSSLGTEVGKAGRDFIETKGKDVFPDAPVLADKIDDFLMSNEKSQMGFSGISDAQMGELKNLSNKLRGIPEEQDVVKHIASVMDNGTYNLSTDDVVSLLKDKTKLNRAIDSGKVDPEEFADLLEKIGAPPRKQLNGEDLYKFRKYLDYQEQLAGKYDKDGTSPFVNFLKSLRGEADGMVDAASPELDAANKAYSQFKSDTNLLRGATNESQAEGMIGNLYGANKGAKQEAAARLFKPETMEAAKDIAANKAFEGAKRPGGDNYFRRMALPVLTLGTSEVVSSPELWKHGLRLLGKAQKVLGQNPQAMGKYGPILENAARRGTQALIATHKILLERPEYREALEEVGQ